MFLLGICVDNDDKLVCPECRRPFSCLPKPESGCEPIGSFHQDFTCDNFRVSTECCGIIDHIKHKVRYNGYILITALQ